MSDDINDTDQPGPATAREDVPAAGEIAEESANMDNVARQLGIFINSCTEQYEKSNNSFQILTLVSLVRIAMEMLGREFRVHIPASKKSVVEEFYREALKRFLSDAKSGRFNKEQIWETASSTNPIPKEKSEA